MRSMLRSTFIRSSALAAAAGGFPLLARADVDPPFFSIFQAANYLGRKLPPYRVPAVDGGVFSPSDFAGHVLYLSVFNDTDKDAGTWLTFLMSEFASQGKVVRFAAVDGWGTEDGAKSLASEFALPFPVGIESQAEMKKRSDWNATGLSFEWPLNVLLDARGVVLDVWAANQDGGLKARLQNLGLDAEKA